MKLIILLSLIFTSCTIPQSTFYLSEFQIAKAVENDKAEARNKIISIAQNLERLSLDRSSTNDDTISFFGPPYHYIQFFITDSSSSATLKIVLKYDGRLASQSLTDQIYSSFVDSLTNTYGERISYKLLEKR